ncbi:MULTISPECIES: NUDIX hydrolase [unclassified Shewanella]|uniref:NUDIX hydrolase n=1 Tax=unclassified Shewanella TaxID=196818 RepID=UPI001BC014E1|nr:MULTISPECIES: NUDIX hydrolase [unclassified Shewanella]GIU12819.1 NUDIX hydrolase [Shewanella sp. MBTL60-112-B1]GIU38192.1 NUDIX hydrolase [Shewanella sp. MBTL60-112-B2]
MTERYKPNTTVACVIEAQGRFLLVEEVIEGETQYNQPAGHIEANESIINACIREVKEETGLSIEPQGVVGIYQFSASETLAFVRYTFYLKLDKQLASQPEDPVIQALKWLTLAEIVAVSPQLRSPLVLKSITDYLAGNHYPLSILNDEYL